MLPKTSEGWILVIICLLALSSSSLFNVGGYIGASQIVKVCKARQETVETALEIFKANHGHYPERLSHAMFENGWIPHCPQSLEHIQYNSETIDIYCKQRSKFWNHKR
jgi:hypothetical protein